MDIIILKIMEYILNMLWPCTDTCTFEKANLNFKVEQKGKQMRCDLKNKDNKNLF